MPLGYQPPKFHQFDGKGDPKQHIAHFIETCNNAGTYDDLLVKQFVRSLKGLAFNWYGPRFCIRWWLGANAKRVLKSLLQLTPHSQHKWVGNTKQFDQEPVIDFNRWRALSLKCKDHLPESSKVEMCAQGMDWDILYALQLMIWSSRLLIMEDGCKMMSQWRRQEI